MPIREYLCQQCNHRFENLEFNDSERPEKCPVCSSDKLEKLFSSFAVSTSNGADFQCGDAPGCSDCMAGGCPYSSGSED